MMSIYGIRTESVRSGGLILLPLWREARRVSSAASRLPGSTSLRLALHGWQHGDGNWLGRLS